MLPAGFTEPFFLAARSAVAEAGGRRRRDAATCARCVHFDNRARTLEAQIPGFLVMGSGYGAARGDDGLCAGQQRYVSAHSSCAQFARAIAEEASPAS